MAHTELSLRERRTVEDMLNPKCSVDEIAVEIGWHRSTVYRETRRNSFADDLILDLNDFGGRNLQG